VARSSARAALNARLHWQDGEVQDIELLLQTRAVSENRSVFFSPVRGSAMPVLTVEKCIMPNVSLTAELPPGP